MGLGYKKPAAPPLSTMGGLKEEAGVQETDGPVSPSFLAHMLGKE